MLIVGVGIWGIDIPVAWGFTITDFVWWIGIGHAGTLISAILLLLHQRWRTSINRIAEAMTIFALMCAGLFPLLHLGRPWFFYWLLPYPNTMRLWPQFRSALVWDVFAVSTYFPGVADVLVHGNDSRSGHACATARRRGAARCFYGVFAMGWRNSASIGTATNRPTCSRPAGHAAGRFRALSRQLRFRHLAHARLARNGIPALFRGRGDFLGLRDGAVALRADLGTSTA